MKTKIFALVFAGALALSAVTGVLAGTGNGNVGTFSGNLTGWIPDGNPTLISSSDWVAYSCGSVHEKIVGGVVQDKQSCTLAAGSALPTKSTTWTGPLAPPATTLDGYPIYWASDYFYQTTGRCMWATSWSWTITPSGTLNIVSNYADQSLINDCSLALP